MTRIFMPPLDSKWRFDADWHSPVGFFLNSDNNQTLGTNNVDFYRDFCSKDPRRRGPSWDAWHERYRTAHEAFHRANGVTVLPAGTVISFERYHVSHSGNHAITIKVLASPDQRLMPKKLGGKMKGAGRLYLLLDHLNTLPEVTDVTDAIPD